MSHITRPSSRRKYKELTNMLAFVNSEWGAGLDDDSVDGPTFLWDESIRYCAQHDDIARADLPVAAADQADTIMRTPMQWYFDGISAQLPDADSMNMGNDMLPESMPAFHFDTQALAGVEAVVANAIASTRWIDAVRNLAHAIELTAQFVGSCKDSEQEALDFLKELIQTTRIYMDALAAQADPATGEEALRIITEIAVNDDFRLNPMPMMELLSCALSFARWDDTVMFAYDVIKRATFVMNDMVAQYGDDVQVNEQFLELVDPYTSQMSDLIDHSDFDDYPMQDVLTPLNEREVKLRIHAQFTQAIILLRHDVLRLSGDAAGADQLLYEHCDMSALADSYAARLIQTEQWAKLLDFIDEIQATHPNQFTLMFPEHLVPYEWDSLREVALQGLNDRDALQDMYRARIVEAYDDDDTRALVNLRRVSGRNWMEQVDLILHEYHDGSDRMVRNPLYERLLISQGLRDAALRYVANFPEAQPDLECIM